MPVGGRANQLVTGIPSPPATLYGAPGLDPAGPQASPGVPAALYTWRKMRLSSALETMAAFSDTGQVARTEGVPAGQVWVIERLTVITSDMLTLYVGVGQVGSLALADIVDMLPDPISFYATLSDPQPIRLLSGEALWVGWPGGTATCTVSLQVRVETL